MDMEEEKNDPTLAKTTTSIPGNRLVADCCGVYCGAAFMYTSAHC